MFCHIFQVDANIRFLWVRAVQIFSRQYIMKLKLGATNLNSSFVQNWMKRTFWTIPNYRIFVSQERIFNVTTCKLLHWNYMKMHFSCLLSCYSSTCKCSTSESRQHAYAKFTLIREFYTHGSSCKCKKKLPHIPHQNL